MPWMRFPMLRGELSCSGDPVYVKTVKSWLGSDLACLTPACHGLCPLSAETSCSRDPAPPSPGWCCHPPDGCHRDTHPCAFPPLAGVAVPPWHCAGSRYKRKLSMSLAPASHWPPRSTHKDGSGPLLHLEPCTHRCGPALCSYARVEGFQSQRETRLGCEPPRLPAG